MKGTYSIRISKNNQAVENTDLERDIKEAINWLAENDSKKLELHQISTNYFVYRSGTGRNVQLVRVPFEINSSGVFTADFSKQTIETNQGGNPLLPTGAIIREIANDSDILLPIERSIDKTESKPVDKALENTITDRSYEEILLPTAVKPCNGCDD